uniref:peroxidase n=1 Tax=Cajanus cajan TaxID=3821 RepID=A0A151UHV1_CAJCA
MAYKTSSITSFIVTLILLATICDAQLSSTFYDGACPNALSTIRSVIRSAVSEERRMAASLIRLHFHDCFVQVRALVLLLIYILMYALLQGCDASILLDDSSSIESEKSALQNANSIRGYNIIDQAKAEVEKVCPGVVSCADIVAVAARDASFAVGGPSWTVKLGRRDSTTASKSMATSDLPLFTDDLDTLISKFSNKGLTAKDMVTLSGN